MKINPISSNIYFGIRRKKRERIEMPEGMRTQSEYLREWEQRRNREKIEMSSINSDFSNATNYAYDHAASVFPYVLSARNQADVSYKYSLMTYNDLKEADFKKQENGIQKITISNLDKDRESATIVTNIENRDFPIVCKARIENGKPVYINEKNVNTNWQNIYKFDYAGNLESYVQIMSNKEREMVYRFFRFDHGRPTYCLDGCKFKEEHPISAKDLHIYEWNDVLINDKAQGLIPKTYKTYDVNLVMTKQGLAIQKVRLERDNTVQPYLN